MVARGISTRIERALLIGEGYLGMGVLCRDEGLIRVRGYAQDEAGMLYERPEMLVPLTEPPPLATTLEPGLAVRFLADATLSSYTFGSQTYDPFESISASMDKASRCPAGLALALWAALEADLFRFAFDQGFTAALATMQGSDEWRRFAGLNDRFRAAVRVIAPLGLVPPAWNAWLRSDVPVKASQGRLARILERMLTRPIVSVARALAAWEHEDAMPGA